MSRSASVVCQGGRVTPRNRRMVCGGKTLINFVKTLELRDTPWFKRKVSKRNDHHHIKSAPLLKILLLNKTAHK